MKKRVGILLLVILCFILLFFGLQQFLSDNSLTIKKISLEALTRQNKTQEDNLVKRVIDGDTVELENGERVRYIGINTPETVSPNSKTGCFGQEAKEVNRKLVEGKKVRLVKDVSDTDKYQRLLRYVYVRDIFVNKYLVQEGFAQASTFPPDVKYSKQFKEAENFARQQKKGLWSKCPSKKS